jgi:hypothetical protein
MRRYVLLGFVVLVVVATLRLLHLEVSTGFRPSNRRATTAIHAVPPPPQLLNDTQERFKLFQNYDAQKPVLVPHLGEMDRRCGCTVARCSQRCEAHSHTQKPCLAFVWEREAKKQCHASSEKSFCWLLQDFAGTERKEGHLMGIRLAERNEKRKEVQRVEQEQRNCPEPGGIYLRWGGGLAKTGSGGWIRNTYFAFAYHTPGYSVNSLETGALSSPPITKSLVTKILSGEWCDLVYSNASSRIHIHVLILVNLWR